MSQAKMQRIVLTHGTTIPTLFCDIAKGMLWVVNEIVPGVFINVCTKFIKK